jgi:hypothetical protein
MALLTEFDKCFRSKTITAMIDLFTIFSKGGIVLWYFHGTTQLLTSSVNELIKNVILQVIISYFVKLWFVKVFKVLNLIEGTRSFNSMESQQYCFTVQT